MQAFQGYFHSKGPTLSLPTNTHTKLLEEFEAFVIGQSSKRSKA